MHTHGPDTGLNNSSNSAARAIIAGKPHVQECLTSMLEQFGFVTCAYNAGGHLTAVFPEFGANLFVMWVSPDDTTDDLSLIARAAAEAFRGRVLLLGSEGALLTRAQELGEKLGLAMLPSLFTPVCEKALWSRVQSLSDAKRVLPDVDLATAISSGWIELWYQPKFDIRTFRMEGAEALARLRHPKWGLIQPNQFIPCANQKTLIALSEFVIDAAMSDWHHFVLDCEDLELAVNIPLKVLTRAACIENIIKKLPHDHRFHRGLVETDVSDVIADPGATKCVAAELMRHQLALSIDDVAEDWIELCAVEDAPLAEIKVDRSVVAGCAKNQVKQSVCRRIVEFARRIEVRTVAEGVETRADLLAAREIGFDLVQGYLCGKPLDRKRFGSLLREPWCAIPQYARAA